jgi:hypothetical protein
MLLRRSLGYNYTLVGGAQVKVVTSMSNYEIYNRRVVTLEFRTYNTSSGLRFTSGEDAFSYFKNFRVCESVGLSFAKSENNGESEDLRIHHGQNVQLT